MIPGENILLAALSLIGSQPVKYYQNTGRTKNAALILEPTFAEVQVIRKCSVQPVPLARFEIMGLDYAKQYVTLFAPRNIIGVDRDKAGDQIEWYGDRYQCESVTPWVGQDGWCSVVCAKIGAANA